MFSETRYAMNGDLRVAYRASAAGERDIVFVPNWFTCCETFPELPSIQGWIDAMTSLGRLIFFDQPDTGASDPVRSGAQPTLEQWADSITAVLDDLGSREAVLLASDGGSATGALFAATHPSRTSALVMLEGYADPVAERDTRPRESWQAWSPLGERARPYMQSIRTCHGTRRFGRHGRDTNAWRRAQGPLLSANGS